MTTMRNLVLPGGGIRGYLQALVLAEIEARAGRPIHKLVDLIIGTSTGGILGAGLALGKPASEMAAFYRDHGPKIFRQSRARRWSSLFGLVDEAYDASGLETALAEVFGDAALSQAKTRLCLTAYDIEGRKPLLFKSWRPNPREDHLLTAVTRATAAAPTYFEPALVKSSTGLMRACVDGGVWANNPAMAGLVESLKLDFTPRRIRMLTVGAGCDERPYFLSDARGWGLAGWARPLLDILFAGQSDAADYQCGEILGSNYLSLQPMFGDPVALDDVSAKAFSTLEFYAGRVIDSSDMPRALSLLGVA
ncbi:patatin-like phospholipase family protein [Solidesulfovibrio sp.]